MIYLLIYEDYSGEIVSRTNISNYNRNSELFSFLFKNRCAVELSESLTFPGIFSFEMYIKRISLRYPKHHDGIIIISDVIESIYNVGQRPAHSKELEELFNSISMTTGQVQDLIKKYAREPVSIIITPIWRPLKFIKK